MGLIGYIRRMAKQRTTQSTLTVHADKSSESFQMKQERELEVGFRSPLARRPPTALIMKLLRDPIHPDASTQQKYKAPISFCHLACQMCHLASLFFAKKFLQIVCTSNMSKILAPKSSLVRYSSSLMTVIVKKHEFTKIIPTDFDLDILILITINQCISHLSTVPWKVNLLL